MQKRGFQQVSIVLRLYIGFAVLGLVIAFGGGGAFWLAKQIHASFSSLTSNSAVTQQLANKLGSQALRSGLRILEIEKTIDADALAQVEQQAVQASSILEDEMQQLKEHANHYQLNQLRQPIEQAGDALGRLNQQRDQLVSSQEQLLQKDQQVREGLATFLLSSSELKKLVAKTTKPDAEFDSYIADIHVMVDDRFGLIEFLLSNMVNTRDPAEIAQIVKRIQYNAKVFNDDMVSLADEVSGLTADHVQKQLKDFNNQISSEGGIVAAYVANQQNITAIEQLGREVNMQLATLDEIVGRMVTFANQDSEDASAAGKASIDSAVRVIAIVVPIVLVFAGLLSFWLAGLIRKPLLHTQEHMQKLAEGDYSQVMQGNYQGEFSVLVAAINSLIEQMREVFSQIQQAAQQLGQVSEGNNQTSATVKAKLEQQTAELSSVATAVTEMESAIKEVAASVETSRDLTQTVEEDIDQGQKVMDDNMTMIDSLDETLQQTSGQVDNLAEASKQIGSIIEVIEGIAEKTNLLALNAAIEAARAGEQGRGFAVVADEVRTLAAQTAESTDSVRNMVTTIQRESMQVFDAMANSREQMAESKLLVGQSSEAMLTIRGNMGEMRGMSDHISVAAQEQHHVASEVTRNVNVIASVAEENYEQIEKVARSSEELQEQVLAIETMLKRFVLK